MLRPYEYMNDGLMKDTCEYNEDFIRNYNEGSGEIYFLEDDVQYSE